MIVAKPDPTNLETSALENKRRWKRFLGLWVVLVMVEVALGLADRFSAMVWSQVSLFLGFCCISMSMIQAPARPKVWTWLMGIFITLGVVLLIVAIVGRR
jgi:hypothetical protein